MKAIRSCWLFQKEPDPLWEQKKLKWWSAWRLIALALMSACWGIALLVIAAGRYPKRDILGFFETPLIAALNLLPVLLLSLLFYLIFNRAWAAFLASGVITLAASMGNYYLLLFRDDPLMAVDVLDFNTGIGFTGKYDLSIDVWVGAVLFCFCLAMAFLLLLAPGRGCGKKLRLSLLAALVLLAWPLTLLYSSDTVYQKKAVNFHYFNQWSDTQQYISRGFLYPFLHSVKELIPSPPAGYDEDAAAEELKSYGSAALPEEKKVNFITIQLEAFSDLTRMGVEGIDSSVYDAYHALEEQSYTGDLVTNIFAGGTVNTERCCITGTSSLKNYRGASNSYAWWLREQGYTLEGSHPCYDWFYNRRNVNEYLGLSEYHYYDDYYVDLADGGLTTDAILFPEIARLFETHTESGDSPYFSFNVSYQNHGPYDAATSARELITGDLSDESRNILNNYLANIEETADALTDLTERLAQSEEPVVLFLFGDHKPWLGYGNSVYTELGVDLDFSTEQGFLNYYGTRYLIWANDAAKAALGKAFVGQGETVSSNFLMNLLFEICGLSGNDYMRFTDEIRQTLPVLTSTGFYLVDGEVKSELNEEQQAALQRYTNVAYYWRENFLFA